MGAIQNSINGMLGTAAIGLSAAASVKEKKAANEEKAVQLEGESAKTDTEISELDEKIGQTLEDDPELHANDLEERLKIEEASGDDQLPDSLTKRYEALTNLGKMRDAKIAIRDSYQKRIKALRGGK